MQTPEKLSLIGGSILLASTLVFTLKSQASDILPKVNNGVSSLMKTDQERQQDQQKQQEQNFNNNFQQAQQNGWPTSKWGTAKFYVDNHNTMHVGSGQLSGPYGNVINTNQVSTINLDAPVQAPANSSGLFTNNYANDTLTGIYGMDQLDTSHVTNMKDMFDGDNALSNIDVSHFDTSQVTDMSEMFGVDYNLSNLSLNHFNTQNVHNMEGMFADDGDLPNLNVSNFNTSNVTSMEDMFDGDSSLSNLDVSHFDTHNVTNMMDMFDGNKSQSLNLSNFDTSKVTDMSQMLEASNTSQLILGPHTGLQNNSDANSEGNYQNNNGQSLSLDGNPHPGTWIKK